MYDTNNSTASSTARRIDFILSEFRQMIDSEDAFESGGCADLAIALFCHAKQEGIDAAFSLVFRTEADKDSFESTCLSHVVVVIASEDFDIGGARASERWEDRWDPMMGGWNDGGCNNFTYVDIPSTDALLAACQQWGVPLNSDRQAMCLALLSRAAEVPMASCSETGPETAGPGQINPQISVPAYARKDQRAAP